jgi:2-oxo-4-hydroxy-4-carboxy-5-ureidoimidazoline decarboxylase
VGAVEAFNSAPAERLRDDLAACCAAPGWSATVLSGRPYGTSPAIVAAADAAARGLSWADVLVGLSAHPRIGQRARGDSREAAWSRSEQSAAATGDDAATAAALVSANEAYEERFGHVFLIFASGRAPGEVLAAARERLGNDEAVERAVVTDELRKIALLRLERLLDALG